MMDQESSFLYWMSRKNILEGDVPFKMGVFLANSTQSLARCRECSLAGWLSMQVPRYTGCHLGRLLPFQVPPDLLGQDNGSIWITEIMIKERIS